MKIPPITALMPMKGHSERVPGKNVRPFMGRPLFHWVAESLLASKYIQRLVINTDSPAIAEDAAAHFDVLILGRPERLLGDMVGMTPLIEHDIAHVDGDHFLQTHSCNPLLSTRTIDAAIEHFFASPDADSLFTVTPWQKRFFWPDGRPVNHDPANMLRTQDLPPIYEENSNFYLFTRASFVANNHRIGKRAVMFPMNPLEALDIDTEAEFLLAEAVAPTVSARFVAATR